MSSRPRSLASVRAQAKAAAKELAARSTNGAVRVLAKANELREPKREAPVRFAFEGEALGFAVRGDVLEVALHRAPVNEIGTTMLSELETLADVVRVDQHGARAIVIHSEMEKGFSAGADLRELHRGLVARRRGGSSKLATAAEARRFIDRIHAVFDALDASPVPVVAMIHGFCFGGGFELALTADVLVAEKSARFCFPELRLGLVPGFGGIPRLRREVGNAVVRDLLFTGRSLSAARAHELGLVSQVTARGAGLGVARAVAAQLAKFDPDTLRAAKAFAKPIPRDELEREKDLFIRLLASPVVAEALRRFDERDDLRPYLP